MVKIDKGSYIVDMVIFCVGFWLNIGLFKGKVDMNVNGLIKINDYM